MERLKNVVNQALDEILAETRPAGDDGSYVPGYTISITRDTRGNVRISYRVNVYLSGDNRKE